MIVTVVFPTGRLLKTAFAVPLVTLTSSLPIVTFPSASSGNVTVTVAFSPSVISGASMLIVAFCLGFTTIVSCVLALLYLSLPL